MSHSLLHQNGLKHDGLQCNYYVLEANLSEYSCLKEPHLSLHISSEEFGAYVDLKSSKGYVRTV